MRFFKVTGPVTSEIDIDTADELVPLYEIFHGLPASGRYHARQTSPGTYHLVARW